MLGLSIGQPGRPISPFPTDAPFALSFVDKLYLVAGEYVLADDAFSVARGSTKLAQDGAGHWHSFEPDVAAITNRGLLLESSATNVLRNSSAQGAGGGNPGTFPTHWARYAGGGPAISVAGVGSEAGLPYIDIRLSGTATSGSGASIQFEQATAAAATPGQTWTGSVFVRLVGGSPGDLSSVRLNLQETNSGGGGTNTNYGADIRDQITSQWLRVQETKELSAATTNFVRVGLELAYMSGAMIDVTLRVSCPQLEAGTLATSPILSAGASQTRVADSMTLILPEAASLLTLRYADGNTEVIEAEGGAFLVDSQDLLRYAVLSTA